MTTRGITVLVGAALGLAATPAFGAGGWVVRICRGATEAAAIKIMVGNPGSPDVELVNWKSDVKETDFPVADTLLKVGSQLHVKADSEPADGKVAMCVLQNGKPAKAMNFVDLADVTVGEKDTDTGCKCP
jgi:hypothetical protein